MVEPSATSVLVSFMFWANAVDALNAPNATTIAASILLRMMGSSASNAPRISWREMLFSQTFVSRQAAGARVWRR
jgi:hypothetical protein